MQIHAPADYYQRFIDSLTRSEETRKSYTKSLEYYCHWLGVKNPNQLITKNLLTSPAAVHKVEDNIIRFINHMKEKKLSYSTIHIRLTATTHFYIINRVNINRKYLSKFKPVHRKVRVNDKAYTHTQIEKILNSTKDYRDKVMILLMANGLRIGALPNLTIGNLNKINNIEGYPPESYIYKIIVYAGEPEQYYTFTNFELAESISAYLDYRQRYGEILRPEAPLLREHFDSNKSGGAALKPPRFVGHRSFHNTISRMLQRTGLKAVRSLADKELNDIPESYGFRKFAITQMKKAKVDFNDREFLVGHKRTMGLDSHYDRTSEEDRLAEYTKAIDLLTISPENRLRKQVAEQEHTIQHKLAEKDKQIEEMMHKQEQFEQLIQSLIDSGQLKPLQHLSRIKV